MKIKYPNGYECETKDEIARRIIKKGQAVEIKAEPKTAELKFDDKKPAEIKPSAKAKA